MSTTSVTCPAFPSITPQVTTLLMSEEEILESIEQEDLFTTLELSDYLYNLDIDFSPYSDICSYSLDNDDDNKYYKMLVKKVRDYSITKDEQLRSMQTCRHAYHLYKIGLFDMNHWARDTECGTTMCIAGSAAALYGELRVISDLYEHYDLYYPENHLVIGECWKLIFRQNNEVGLEAVKFVLNKAQERGFISIK